MAGLNSSGDTSDIFLNQNECSGSLDAYYISSGKMGGRCTHEVHQYQQREHIYYKGKALKLNTFKPAQLTSVLSLSPLLTSHSLSLPAVEREGLPVLLSAVLDELFFTRQRIHSIPQLKY